jgi:hypothetical protein
MKAKTALIAFAATVLGASGALALDPDPTNPAWAAENARAKARADAGFDPTYEMTGPGLVKWLVMNGVYAERYGRGVYVEPGYHGHPRHGWSDRDRMYRTR